MNHGFDLKRELHRFARAYTNSDFIVLLPLDTISLALNPSQFHHPDIGPINVPQPAGSVQNFNPQNTVCSRSITRPRDDQVR